MTDNTQPKALRLAELLTADEWPGNMTLVSYARECVAELRRQHARIAELEAQLEAIGAGGVSGPLMGQPQAMPDLSALTERGAKAWAGVDAQGLREGRWYMVTHDGVATLCEDRRDAEEEAKAADMAWPYSGPHRAVQLVEASMAGYTAADMATASAQGFRDGVASVAASAPAPSAHIKEPYTLAEIKAKIASNDYGAEMLLQHAMLLLDSASLAASAGSEPVAWLVCTEEGDPDMVFLSQHEAQQYLEDDERPTPLYTHPSPSEGMVGGWISVDKRLPEPNVEVLCAGQGWGKPFVTACYYDDGRREWYPINTYWTDSPGSAQYPTHWMPLPPPPTSSADSRKGE